MDEIGTVSIDLKWDRDADRYTNRITHADPRVRIGSELLDNIRAASGDYADEYSRIQLDGDVLTIRDDYGQRFIYRIHWDDYADGGYLAEWPD